MNDIKADAKPAMDAVDPPPGETDERGEVLITCEPFRLESSHLAGRCRITLDSLAADRREIISAG